ncbi:MAG: hypothetical protein IJJ76_08330 [Ruminococcus sp.]|uniref:hypothetical protein n=1 Tax=Ruminococcus sp. TaxID=41978 RepID=UPI0025F83DDD|nr:hypothetical protein [Ruminococcus sp.]MBR0529753.1 hypothetical protein [Ruminococcus sp.]
MILYERSVFHVDHPHRDPVLTTTKVQGRYTVLCLKISFKSQFMLTFDDVSPIVQYTIVF